MNVAIVIVSLVIHGVLMPVDNRQWEQPGHFGQQYEYTIAPLLYIHSYNLAQINPDRVLALYSDGTSQWLEVTSTDHYLSNAPYQVQNDLLTPQGWQTITSVAMEHTTMNSMTIITCWETDGIVKGRVFLNYSIPEEVYNANEAR
jgi:hypothetical protein